MEQVRNTHETILDSEDHFEIDSPEITVVFRKNGIQSVEETEPEEISEENKQRIQYMDTHPDPDKFISVVYERFINENKKIGSDMMEFITLDKFKTFIERFL